MVAYNIHDPFGGPCLKMPDIQVSMRLSAIYQLVYWLFVTIGIILIFASAIFSINQYDFLASISANVGRSILATAITLFMILRYTEDTIREISSDERREVQELFVNAQDEIHAQLADIVSLNHKSMARIDALNETIIEEKSGKLLSKSGIVSALFVEASYIEDEYIKSGRNLTIKLKDGSSFFKKNRHELILDRSRRGLKTCVLILHPNYEHMAAVASMDEFKNGRPDIQKTIV